MEKFTLPLTRFSKEEELKGVRERKTLKNHIVFDFCGQPLTVLFWASRRWQLLLFKCGVDCFLNPGKFGLVILTSASNDFKGLFLVVNAGYFRAVPFAAWNIFVG